jgi:hypothetical protein
MDPEGGEPFRLNSYNYFFSVLAFPELRIARHKAKRQACDLNDVPSEPQPGRCPPGWCGSWNWKRSTVTLAFTFSRNFIPASAACAVASHPQLGIDKALTGISILPSRPTGNVRLVSSEFNNSISIFRLLPFWGSRGNPRAKNWRFSNPLQ